MTQRPAKATARGATTILRIQTTQLNPSVLYAVNNASAPGYGLQLVFNQAKLLDGNDNPLASGAVLVSVNPAAVSQFDLTILCYMLQRFQGFYELDVQGSYTATGANISVLADSILASSFQPELSMRKKLTTANSAEAKLMTTGQQSNTAEVRPRGASVLLRISATNPKIFQIEYMANTSQPYPGHGFVVDFSNADLSDANNNPLASGMTILYANPAAVSQFDLAILSCIMQTHQGMYVLNVIGSYIAATPGTPYATVVADSFDVSSLQPTNPAPPQRAGG